MHKKNTTLTLVAALLFLPQIAQSASATGPSIGVRASYGIPFGDATKATQLDSLATGTVQGQIDLGWHFASQLTLGVYAAYGPTFVGDSAKQMLEELDGYDSSGHFATRLGVQAMYGFGARAGFTPWLGLGLGYEWSRYASAKLLGSNNFGFGLGGPEAALQIGGDIHILPFFSVGPFASLNVGRYQKRLFWQDNEVERSTTIENKVIHSWLQIGLKGTFDF